MMSAEGLGYKHDWPRSTEKETLNLPGKEEEVG